VRFESALSIWLPILAMVAVYHLCRWSAPARELARAALAVHKGQAPLEDLSRVAVDNGGLGLLRSVLQEILTDLKQQKSAMATVQDEIRQHVAVKTESLSRRIGSLQMQAARDALTGLLNRRSLDVSLERAVEQFRSVGTDVCLLMIDVDHFKGLNDTLGHPAGDELLKCIAQIIRSSIRDGDQAFRSGGDEFVVLLGGCDIKTGIRMGERIASLVAQFTKSMRVAHPPTLSVGACALNELETVSAISILKAADERLYAVKSTRPRTRKIG
jgi:diguanylate cyclase (GGDEF)-like protein